MAVMGLYKVSRTCQRLSMKDDFSKVAWTKLMEQQMQERDQRVQNAFIVAQVKIPLECIHGNFKLIFVLLGWDGMDEMGNVKNLSVFFCCFFII